MKAPRIPWLAPGLALLVLVLGSCVVTGVGVEGTAGYGYDAGYYEPWGYDYGGWGHGYRVGPGRGGDRRGGGDPRGGDQRGEHPSRPYRAAPESRPTPSIPHGSRGSRH
jgi:hypothetical protein